MPYMSFAMKSEMESVTTDGQFPLSPISSNRQQGPEPQEVERPVQRRHGEGTQEDEQPVQLRHGQGPQEVEQPVQSRIGQGPQEVERPVQRRHGQGPQEVEQPVQSRRGPPGKVFAISNGQMSHRTGIEMIFIFIYLSQVHQLGSDAGFTLMYLPTWV
jgi:hypothetical protein